MTWAKFEDTFPQHPKIRRLSGDAFKLHVAAICWSNQWLTDGHIPTEQIDALVPRYKPAMVNELMKAKPGENPLWVMVEHGWQIHGYLDYQPAAEQVKAERAVNAERQRRWAAQQKAKRSPNGAPNSVSGGATSPATNARPGPGPGPVPVGLPPKSRSGLTLEEREAQGGNAEAEDHPTTDHGRDGWGNPEATGPNENPDTRNRRRALAIRWAEVLRDRGGPDDLLACNQEIANLLHQVDARIIDEQIGWQADATDPPRTPTVLADAVRRITSR